MGIYQDLGVERIINAASAQTKLGGSLMPPPVLTAMADAASAFVDIQELHDRVGERLAALSRNEAACVSSGAAAGILLAVAACLTGPDPERTNSLPDVTGLARTEILVFKEQKNGFLSAATQTGARLIELDPTAQALESAINERTAAVLWFAADIFADGAPPLTDIVRIAHSQDIPVIVDAAAQIPPISNLWHYTREIGADVAIFSGGKGLRGPQTSGIVLGRRDIIAACRDHTGPYHSLGRPAKVGKEEMIGLLAAVEWSLSLNEPDTLANYASMAQRWHKEIENLPDVSSELTATSAVGQPIPHVIVRIDSGTLWTRDEVVSALWDDSPRIAVTLVGDNGLAFSPEFVMDNEASTVAERLKKIFAKTPDRNNR